MCDLGITGVTPVKPRSSKKQDACSFPVHPGALTVQHGGASVHAGIPRCYPGCLRWCPGNCPLCHGYMSVAPLLRPGGTLHYKNRIKTWSSISFLLFLSHNIFKEKTLNRHKLDCTASYGRLRLESSD